LFVDEEKLKADKPFI